MIRDSRRSEFCQRDFEHSSGCRTRFAWWPGLWIDGNRSADFLGRDDGIFSLVPVVGSALIWVPASISLMLEGHILHGIILASLSAA